jgi:hypothetical protein
MVSFTTIISKFNKKGEKTGWSFIEITQKQAEKLKPGCRVSFRVKGKIDDFILNKTAILPMGDGSFILPVNGQIRKAIKKNAGDKVKVELHLDERPLTLLPEFIQCLKDDSIAYEFFQTLPKSHQTYFSKWIESAKTVSTRTKRITMAVIALSEKQGFGEMIRSNKKDRL